MGRKATYTDATQVSVQGATARSKLQTSSERRAIIDKIVDMGGTTTIAKLEAHFGYDLKGKVAALVRIGWLLATEERTDGHQTVKTAGPVHLNKIEDAE